MRRRLGSRAVAAAAAAVAIGCAGTRPLSEPAPFSAHLAASLAWSAGGTPRFDIAVALPCSALRELAARDDPKVRLVLHADVTMPAGKSMASEVWTQQLAVGDLESGGDLHWCVSLATAPGPQQLGLTVLVQGQPWGVPWTRGFEVPTPVPAALYLGEPVFLTARPAASTAAGSAADSACFDLLVGRYYDAETGPPRLRTAVYDFAADVDTSFVLAYAVRGLDASASAAAPQLPVAAGTLRVRRRGPVTPVVLELPPVPLGRHEVELSLQGSKRRTSVTGRFEMGLVDLAALAASAGGMELLELLLSSTAADSLRRAVPEAREALWNELWRRRDPEPSTPANEARDAALARVRAANLRFGDTRPGWRTDRGRVYIAYGAPDAVDTMPNPEGFDRLERWTYVAPRFVFVFVDRDGRGEYTLLRTNAPDF